MRSCYASALLPCAPAQPRTRRPSFTIAAICASLKPSSTRISRECSPRRGTPLRISPPLRRFAGLEAEIERHVVLLQQTDPVLCRPGKENVLQQFRQRIAVRTAFLIV